MGNSYLLKPQVSIRKSIFYPISRLSLGESKIILKRRQNKRLNSIDVIRNDDNKLLWTPNLQYMTIYTELNVITLSYKQISYFQVFTSIFPICLRDWTNDCAVMTIEPALLWQRSMTQQGKLVALSYSPLMVIERLPLRINTRQAYKVIDKNYVYLLRVCWFFLSFSWN